MATHAPTPGRRRPVAFGPAEVLRLALLAAAYAGAAILGHSLAFLPPGNVSAVFPASGIALAALLLGGNRLWPGVWLGSFLGNAWVLVQFRPGAPAVGLACAAAISTGAALQAVVSAGLFRQTTGMLDPFARARDAALFVAVALGGCLINATVSTASLTLGGYVAWPDVGETWLTWWLGDASGVLVVAPLLLAWAGGPPPIRANRLPGLVVLLALPFAVGHAVARTGYPLEYLYLPPLTWAAFRFGPRGATVLTALTAGVAIATTVQGLGAFRGRTPNESLMLLQAFAGTVAASTLLLVGVIAQRDTAERELATAIDSLEARVRLRTQELAAANTRLQRIAGVDPLTEVANRRQFDETLGREWRRCGRAGVPLAVILMDIDHFKKFNDTYGHPAGDECLRRVAGVLAGGLQRSGELLARYGGEEFVALLPGATADDALRTAERLRQRVAATAIPHPHSAAQAVTFSGGVAATVPVGPESPLPLLAAADSALYEAKHAGRNCVRRAP